MDDAWGSHPVSASPLNTAKQQMLPTYPTFARESMPPESTSFITTAGGLAVGKKTEVHDPLDILLPEALANLKLDHISRPEAPSLDDSPQSIDSGYVTAGSTPSGKSDSQEDGACTPFKERRTISFLHRKVTKLRPFDKEIPQSTRDRFEDLIELFCEPLYEHLSKAKIRHAPISIKLKVIGKNEADAKPWIIVLCDKAVERKIRQFFNQPQVKTECQPNEGDPSVPSFKVLVESRPPREVAAMSYEKLYDVAATVPTRPHDWTSEHTKVYYRTKSSVSTLCGTSIEVAYAGTTRTATPGGIVKVIKPDGSALLLGMTAGHILGEPQLDIATSSDGRQPLYPMQVDGHDSEMQVDGYDSEDTSDDNGEDVDSTLASDEAFELDMSFDEDTIHPYKDLETESAPSSSPSNGYRQVDGHIFAVSKDTQGSKRNFDWALICLYDSQSLRPNLVGGMYRELTDLYQGLGEVAPRLNRPVYVLSGMGAFKLGTMMMPKSYMTRSTSKRMVATYNVSLSCGLGLSAGDCGSWVVDAFDYKVYGHVVAVDVFNEAYIVPLETVFADIKDQLHASSARLANKTEIMLHMTQTKKETSPPVLFQQPDRLPSVFNSDSGYVTMEFTPPSALFQQPDHIPSVFNSDSGYATMESSPIPSPPQTYFGPQSLPGARIVEPPQEQSSVHNPFTAIRDKIRGWTAKTKSSNSRTN